VQGGKTLKEIVTVRGLTSKTILSHLEKLRERKLLPAMNIAQFAEVNEAAVEEVAAAFTKLNTDYLKPVFVELNERYPYELIYLVRMQLGKQIPQHEKKETKQPSVPRSTGRDKPNKLGSKWSEREEREMEQYYNDGMSVREIANKLERLPGGIRARLKKLGLIKYEGA
jgi:DNA-binding CsgD family transcriptional regulator